MVPPPFVYLFIFRAKAILLVIMRNLGFQVLKEEIRMKQIDH